MGILAGDATRPGQRERDRAWRFTAIARGKSIRAGL
jgi:hypothetical protein